MYTVNEMPPRIDAARLKALAEIETATIGHYRMHGFMSTRLTPVLTGVRVAGTAVTVRTVTVDSAAILMAIDGLRPGDFLIVDRSGEDRHACFGLVTAAAVKASGAVGVIIDGRACDFPDIRKHGVPLWCAGASPILGRKVGLGGEVNVPISCGGQAVNPGDAVLADESGILVIPPHEIEAIVEEGLARQAREPGILKRLAAGEKLSAITGAAKFEVTKK